MVTIQIDLTHQQAEALERISSAEYRRPQDHVRMLIDDHIKDYEG